MTMKVDFKDDMPVLKGLCKTYSKIMGNGRTVFPVHTDIGYARIVVRQPSGLRDPLMSGRIAQLCAIITWEIDKAKGAA